VTSAKRLKGWEIMRTKTKILIYTPINIFLILWAIGVQKASDSIICAFVFLLGLSLFNAGTLQSHRSMKVRIAIGVIGCLVMFIITPILMVLIKKI
jgi:hypothetical protein